MSKPWQDFIHQFMAFTHHDPSPLPFRLWSAIAAVSGALERRVWARAVPRRDTFANMYILLTAAPGVGKQCVSTVRSLWKETLEDGSAARAFHVAPNNMTKASLIDRLGKSKNMRQIKGMAEPYVYNSLLIAAEEFQVLLPNYDTEYIATLNEIFNSPAYYDEERRTGRVQEIVIEQPQLTILGGVQPSYFVSTFPEEAWSTGFARRIIMIYANEAPEVTLFSNVDEDPLLRKSLLAQLSHMSGLFGQMGWRPAARDALVGWSTKSLLGGPPFPEHSKLLHYTNSRLMFTVKLAMVACVARCGGLVIEAEDVLRAIGWLCEAEAKMVDVFREMLGKSDSAVIDELHYMVTRLYLAKRQKPVHSEVVYEFLKQRVPADKVDRIFILAARSGIIRNPDQEECSRQKLTWPQEQLWVPKGRHERGVE